MEGVELKGEILFGGRDAGVANEGHGSPAEKYVPGVPTSSICPQSRPEIKLSGYPLL
jgi:hypothetical protein